MTIWVRIGAISLMVLILTLAIGIPIDEYKHATKLYKGYDEVRLKYSHKGAIENLVFNIIMIVIPFVIPFLLVALFG